jgi:two-component system cell cycle sensor histidine kinase/response regulator CckA
MDAHQHPMRAGQGPSPDQKWFEPLVNAIDGIVWEAEPDTLRMVFVSRQAERILGYPVERWIVEADFWSTHLHPADREGTMRFCKAMTAAGEAHLLEYRMIAADGRTIWLRDSATITVEPGGAVRLHGIMTDVTPLKEAEDARRQLEEQLRQAQKMEAIGRLAGGVAHDFNNLLTAILGYSQLLLTDFDPAPEIREQIEEIERAGRRAASLTRQLLAFSRKQILQPKVLDLNGVVADTVKMLRRLLGEHIELEMTLADSLGMVLADPGQLEQVILNVAINARDAMASGGVLTIETLNVTLTRDFTVRHSGIEPGRYVALSIRDTGVGMDAGTVAHMFEPFFSTKPRGEGTGLGLSTVYGIVKQSGGNIAVYSELGRGTTIDIYLPRTDAVPENCPANEDPRPLSGGAEHILLVEDDEMTRSLTVKVLRQAGYDVFEAADGREALLLSRSPGVIFDLLVTDVVMPVMSGHELWRQLRISAPRLKVLFMSGYLEDSPPHQRVCDQPSLLLQKPFTPADLCRKVREALL